MTSAAIDHWFAQGEGLGRSIVTPREGTIAMVTAGARHDRA
jgi:hypothetical protein